ncbi:unnamed protein product [Polarella glacialis]|uniref:SnoaL-like domain-containing protein n=1 Tax=Polarella glacialis TaxID=89957 RepID=A0A813EVQ8_POLGL|nr:unnamed protein product [Polarella glacialis]
METPGSGDFQLTRAAAVAWVTAYGKAWSSQDSDAIVALYTEDAPYVERPYDPVGGIYHGHHGIREYWESHIKTNERNIEFRQLEEDLVFDSETRTAVAKWEARFEVAQANSSWKKVQFLQIAKLRFAPDGRVQHFEEFWHAKSLQRAPKGLRDPRARRPRTGVKRRIPDFGGRTCAHVALFASHLGPFAREAVKVKVRARPGMPENRDAEEAQGLEAVPPLLGKVADVPAAAEEAAALADKSEHAHNGFNLRGVPLMPAVWTCTKNDLGVAKSSDLVEWYRRAVIVAGLAEESDVSGVPLLRPSGTFLWEEMRRWVDAEMRKLGIESFRPPTLAHRKDGKDAEAQAYVGVRTSTEVLLYTNLAKHWVKSSHDLPVLLQHWGAAVTSETIKRPLPFLRTRELLMQEGHAVYAGTAEAAVLAEKVQGLYVRMCEDLLAVAPRVRRGPLMVGVLSKAPAALSEPSTPSTSSQKQALNPRNDATGENAEFTQSSLMIDIPVPLTSDGQLVGDESEPRPGAIEVASVHQLGCDTSAQFRLNFASKDPQTGKSVARPCAQTSFLVTCRALGAALCSHGDDRGLVLPPRLAPLQVVIIPASRRERLRFLSSQRKPVPSDLAPFPRKATAASHPESQAAAQESWCERLLEELREEVGSDKNDAAWERGPLRAQIDNRQDIPSAMKISLWKQRGVPLLVVAHEEAGKVRLIPRDMRRGDVPVGADCDDDVMTDQAAARARQALAAFHQRLLAAHRAATTQTEPEQH